MKAMTEWSCQLTTATLYTVSDYTVWLIIAVTVERYVVVCHALTARAVCRRRRAFAVIAALLATFIAFNLHFLWTVELSYTQVSGILLLSSGRRLQAATGSAVECDSSGGILPSASRHESRLRILLAKSQNSLQHVHCRFKKSSARCLLHRPSSGFATELTILISFEWASEKE